MLFTSNIARQEPGRIIIRHFCDWLLYYNIYRPSLIVSQSPRVSGIRISNSIIVRQIESI
jgi:hypothetical protein